MEQIALVLGVTKNAVIGKLDRLREYEYDGSTVMDRLQALHDRMDAVLAETTCKPSHKIYGEAGELTHIPVLPKTLS
jgi:hypothetical protein